MISPAVDLRCISKTFSGTPVLKNVSLQVQAGKCLGLVGENGAGKSTLMKILSGVWPWGSYGGEIFLKGKLQKFMTPQEAWKSGIRIVHQEFSLFDHLTVAENIFMQELRGPFFSKTKLFHKSQKILDYFQCHISPQKMMKTLSIAERQLIEIVRIFSCGPPPSVLIFDEPTSALSEQEIDRLFVWIKNLKKQNCACIYISHKLNEIKELCDQSVVLRDGESIAHFSKEEFCEQKMMEAMVGRKINSLYPPKPSFLFRSPLLEVRGLTYRDATTHQPILNNIYFSLHHGEIMGIAGLMGSGRSALLKALYGTLDAKHMGGEIFLQGKKINLSSPEQALSQGFAFVTEDRKRTGLFLDLNIRLNMTLSILKKISFWGMLRSAEERNQVKHYCELLKIRKDPGLLVKNLSGGNQQKVILSRWLLTQPTILLLDEPTRGIDVCTKQELYVFIRALAKEGLAILLASSELPELVHLSDRVLVMKEGEIAGTCGETEEITPINIIKKAAA